jgi:ADP-ribose pyrophosphatase YjhB (NUDIX family)
MIHYQNPRIIVGCLPIWADKVMLCRRGIEPQYGLWNIPGGFMENDESVEDGALREMMEETFAPVRLIGLHSVFSVLPVNQVHLHFLVEVLNPNNFKLTPETTEIQFFTEGDINWKDIAFASNTFALRQYFEDQKQGLQRVHRGSLIYKEGRWKILKT